VFSAHITVTLFLILSKLLQSVRIQQSLESLMTEPLVTVLYYKKSKQNETERWRAGLCPAVYSTQLGDVEGRGKPEP
jgi:hypothetical protein